MKDIGSKHVSRMDTDFLSILLAVGRMTAMNGVGKSVHSSHTPAPHGSSGGPQTGATGIISPLAPGSPWSKWCPARLPPALSMSCPQTHCRQKFLLV